MKNITLLLVTLLLVGITNCVPTKKLCQKCPTKDSINYVETVTENPYYTIPDTAYWNLQFECDSNFNVILRELEDASNTMHTETVIKEVIRYKADNTKVTNLMVSLKAISDSILVRDKLIEKLRSEVKTIKVPEPYPVYKSRKIFIYSFFILLGIILISIGWLFLKYRAKILGLFK